MRIAVASVMVFAATACVMTPEHAVSRLVDGWERCERHRDGSICTWTAMARNGSRVCAVRQDFATNVYYTHRLTGSADGDRVKFDQICGDPGSETDSYCAGQAPQGAQNVGWAPYDQTVHLCDGRLSDDPAGCTGANADADMIPISLARLPLTDDDRHWLTRCAAGA